MIWIYNCLIRLYFIAICMASLFNEKAKKWLAGRRGWQENLMKKIGHSQLPVAWFHVASVGEYEQAAPIIALYKQTNRYFILVTFFSPSGFEMPQKKQLAHATAYLPLDTPSNAKTFIAIAKPAICFFVKYDFWHHFIQQIHVKKIPLILISAAFRSNQILFRWYGGFYKKMIERFDIIFCQNESTHHLVQQDLHTKTIYTGDTRLDRVFNNIDSSIIPQDIIRFSTNATAVIVAGSTWLEDDKMLSSWLKKSNYKAIIVPHDIHHHRLNQCLKLYKQAQLYSDYTIHPNPNTQVIIINKMGLLSQLYSLGYINYVGGGFTKDGIHNILEPAVFGKPIVIGPNFKKYHEAVALVNRNAAFSVNNASHLNTCINNLGNTVSYQQAGKQASKYIQDNLGSVAIIQKQLEELNWL